MLVNKMKYFQHPPAVVGPQYGYAPLSPGKTRYLYWVSAFPKKQKQTLILSVWIVCLRAHNIFIIWAMVKRLPMISLSLMLLHMLILLAHFHCHVVYQKGMLSVYHISISIRDRPNHLQALRCIKFLILVEVDSSRCLLINSSSSCFSQSNKT